MMTTQHTSTGTMAAELDNAEREAEGIKNFPWLFESDDEESGETYEVE